MRRDRILVGILLISISLPAVGAAPRSPRTESTGGVSDRSVEIAIQAGIEFLWKRQLPDGSWGPQGTPPHHVYPVGPTALVCYALLESGVKVQDPRMAKALAWLAKQKTDRTYSVALRANVWLAANKQTKGEYLSRLRADKDILVKSTRLGSYGYVSDGKPHSGDNSNSQFGLLGVWAARQADIEVSSRYWDMVLRHWERTQNPDGGWPYNTKSTTPSQRQTKPTMTAAGVASLFVCLDNVNPQQFVGCARDIRDPHLERGLGYFDKNLARIIGTLSHYGLYGVERVGLACGYKFFGTADWYKLGAKRLLNDPSLIKAWGGAWLPKPQADAGADGYNVLAAGPAPKKPGPNDKKKDVEAEQDRGAPGSLPNSSFALLFLVRGRNPVLFNKLEFEGDWNNRPRDLATLTRYLGDTFEKTLNWQVINLRVPVRQLHDAPILYISGSKEPKFSDADLEKLRTYVWQGGTLLSATECNGPGFRKGIRTIYAKLFPKYELVPVDPSHPLYNAHFELRGMPKLSVVSNGVRPLAIHTDMDLPKEWQLQNRVTRKWAFESPGNIYMYITDAGDLRPRGTTHWPDAADVKTDHTIKLARLTHVGNCDPEPLAYERLRLLMAKETRTKLVVVGPIEIDQLPGSGAKVATLTGTGQFTLTDTQKKALKSFVEKGGTLIVDAAGGTKYTVDPATQIRKPVGFAASAEQNVEAVFGDGSLRRLSMSAPPFAMPAHRIDRVTYRRGTKARLANMKTHNLRGVLIGERLRVIVSREDLTAGLVGYASGAVDGYSPDSAVDLMRNLILYAAPKPKPKPKPPTTKPATTKPAGKPAAKPAPKKPPAKKPATPATK